MDDEKELEGGEVSEAALGDVFEAEAEDDEVDAFAGFAETTDDDKEGGW